MEILILFSFFCCSIFHITGIQSPIRNCLNFPKIRYFLSFPLVPLCRGGNLQFWCHQFSAGYFLISCIFSYGLQDFILQQHCVYHFYYPVLFSSLDLCAGYYDYFSALTQILRAPCNTDEIGGRRHLPSPAAPQYPIVALPICLPLLSIRPPCLCPVWSGPSGPSGQSGLSLQVNFSHTVKLHKGIISPRDLMILLPHLKIDIDTITLIMIQNQLPSPFVPPSYRPHPPQPIIKRDTLRQFLPYHPLLLLMPPHLMLRPPQMPLYPDH